MKHILLTLTTILTAMILMDSCSSDATYAEQVEAERDAISNFISNHKIQVIDKGTFEAQGCTTDTTKNQYVLLNSTGVYMQIREKGDDGKPLPKGTGAKVISRFTETCVNTNTITNTNTYMRYGSYYDSFNVWNTSGTYTASFITDPPGMMYLMYGSTSVPGGWLVPLKYINLGKGWLFENGEDIPGHIAHVRIIVPHDQGTSTASSNVYAYYYDLTYQLASDETLKQE